MKIRNSFVSNSSSSSFVFLGVKVENVDYEKAEEIGIDYLYVENNDAYCLVGKSFGSWDECDSVLESISMKSISKHVKDIKKNLKKLGLDNTHEPIELHFGVTAS